MKSNKQIFLATIILLVGSPAIAKKSLSAHEHGSATISLAYDKNSVEIELEAPADSVLGFEHAPKSEKEKKAFENAKTLWENLATELMVFSKDLNCKVTQSAFKQEMGEEERDHGKHKDHDKDHHEEGHSEIEASATVTCEKPISGDVTVSFRKHFKKMKNVKLEVVGSKPQSIKLKKDSEIIKL